MQIFVKDKSFYHKLLSISVPIALQNLITFGVNMMDTVMVGQLGEVQLTATSLDVYKRQRRGRKWQAAFPRRPHGRGGEEQRCFPW